MAKSLSTTKIAEKIAAEITRLMDNVHYSEMRMKELDAKMSAEPNGPRMGDIASYKVEKDSTDLDKRDQAGLWIAARALGVDDAVSDIVSAHRQKRGWI